MSLWLASITKENWEILKTIDFRHLGMNECFKRTMARVENGDFIVVYLASNISSLTALLRVKSRAYNVSKSIWSQNLFVTIDVEPVAILNEENRIKVKPLLSSLKFVKNKKNWGNHFRRSISEIKKPDIKIFERIFKRKLV